jgi:transposase
MKRGSRTYSDEFRREAARLLESGEKPLKQIARDLEVSPATLRSWRARFGRSAAKAPKNTVPLLEAENRRLRRENARLLEEREILKKATAFFAKDAR